MHPHLTLVGALVIWLDLIPAVLSAVVVLRRPAGDFRSAERPFVLAVLALAAVSGLGAFAAAWYVVAVRRRLPRRAVLVGPVDAFVRWARSWAVSVRTVLQAVGVVPSGARARRSASVVVPLRRRSR